MHFPPLRRYTHYRVRSLVHFFARPATPTIVALGLFLFLALQGCFEFLKKVLRPDKKLKTTFFIQLIVFGKEMRSKQRKEL